MKSTQTNWIGFTTVLASRIIKDAVVPLNNADRENVLCIDDSMFERNRSRKVVYFMDTEEHGYKSYNYGFTLNQEGVIEEWLNSKAKTARKFVFL